VLELKAKNSQYIQ